MLRRTREFEIRGITTNEDGTFNAEAVLKDNIKTERFERMIKEQMPSQFYFLEDGKMTLRPVGKLSLISTAHEIYRLTGSFFPDPERDGFLQLLQVWEKAFLFLRTRRLNEDRETLENASIRIGSWEGWRQPSPSVKRKWAEKRKKARKKRRNR